MIDYFTLALTHGLIALALWRMLFRDDLDAEDGSGAALRRPWRRAEPDGPEPGDA